MTWEEQGEDGLVRDFEFGDFAAAIAFVNRVAEVAEAANHHPDILVHDYKRVRLTLIDPLRRPRHRRRPSPGTPHRRARADRLRSRYACALPSMTDDLPRSHGRHLCGRNRPS